RGPLLPVWLAAFIVWTFPVWPFAGSAPAAGPSPAPPAPGASTSADLVNEFHQLETAAHALDPAAPDATPRLRDLAERLARAGGQLAREVAQLRAGREATAARVGASPRGGSHPPAVSRAGAASAAPRPGAGATSESAPSAPFFARRGLRKFHRAGCVFG